MAFTPSTTPQENKGENQEAELKKKKVIEGRFKLTFSILRLEDSTEYDSN